jgi:RTX calcium-binding nonapeptide repeat (4 copies)/FG-GAP repeat/FG-GAP-like repeat
MVFSEFNLSNLNGSNGFIINGVSLKDDRAGRKVSNAGDVNGDGIDDLVIGALFASPNGKTGAGQTYVVFGSSSGFSASFNLSSLNGNNGFALNGINEYDFSGSSVSGAGDINGDGIDDVIVGSLNSGQAYVVFGRSSGFSPSLNLSNLNGSNGFVLNGVQVGAYNGASVSDAGDINGDGIDDLVIGDQLQRSGQAYVVFGQSGGFSPSFNLSSLNGNNGFVLNGNNDFTGASVDGVGDMNGDGIDDLIVGAPSASPNGKTGAGQAYVVFGQSGGFSPSFNLSSLNGNNGFALNGISDFDALGYSVSGTGDVNGDGIDDLIVGARQASPNGNASGQDYVVFGSRNGFGASIDASRLDGSNGFALNGIKELDFAGSSVSGAGDIDGDGINDLIVGAYEADPSGKSGAGQTYLVFGSSQGFDSSINLSSLNGSNGFTLNGINEFDESGISVSDAGDINDDGLDDFIIGTLKSLNSPPGQSYVVYGFIPGLTLNTPLIDATNLTRGAISVNLSRSRSTLVIQQALGSKALNLPGYRDIKGTRFADTLIGNADNNVLIGNAGNDLLNGRAGNDTLLGGNGNDVMYGDNGGDVLKGDRGNDLLDGGKGNDYLTGGTGSDVLLGGRGHDFLVGGADNDRLTGSTGNDQFYFKTSQPSASVNFGVDQIRDFNRTAGNTDKIVLSRATFASGTCFASVKSDALAARNAAYITFSTATGHLFYNQNGSAVGLGTGTQFANLISINGNSASETNTLLATDFLIVA